MSNLDVPARLADRPTVGGLVIPWITVTLADGSPDWRACIRHRVNQCISDRRCQLDGQRIPGIAVFFAADDQMPAAPGQPIVTDVPPVHPECWSYAAQACPMLAGRASTYAERPRRAATSRQNVCTEPGCDCGGWISVDPRGEAMAGREVGTWYAVWATDWAMTPDRSGGLFAVVAAPRRIRPVPREVAGV